LDLRLRLQQDWPSCPAQRLKALHPPQAENETSSLDSTIFLFAP
jgi:hypothetical protein